MLKVKKKVKKEVMKYRCITSPDINNGLGCRVTLWVSGCNRKCPHCHNSELWDYTIGKDLTECFEELQPILQKSYIKGLTLSGGDPLDQTNESLFELIQLIRKVKEQFPTKDIWIYCGEEFENIVQNELAKEVLKLCDVLVDGKFIMEQRDITLPFRGSRNQRLIDLKKTFNCGNVVNFEITD